MSDRTTGSGLDPAGEPLVDPAGGQGARALPALAVGRPVTMLMVLLAVLLLGAIAWVRIPVQLMPSGFEIPYLWVWAGYPDSTPRETTEQIVRPAEDALGTLPGLRSINAQASANWAWFSLEFGQGQDMAEAYNEVADRLDRVMVDMPDDFERFNIYKYDPNDESILWAGVSIPEGVEDPVYELESQLQSRLERVEGVGRVEIYGYNRARIYVDFNREELERRRVSLYQVMQQLGQDNFTMPSGQLREGGRVVFVRSLARQAGPEELAATPIGPGLVLGDVAEVIEGIPATADINRIDGQRAVSLEIYKESTANTIDVCAAVREILEEEVPHDPALDGYRFVVFFDEGKMVEESIANTRQAALYGGILATFVLVAFLRRLRLTLTVALAIPLSLLITIVIMYFRGDSANLLSMMGLMLAVGMVVDNSIVVVENIYRRRQLGDSVRQSAIKGAAEVSLAIIMSTATTVAVFLPLIVMSGDTAMSFYLGQLGLPICFALVASLLVAVLVIPLASTRIHEKPPTEDGRLLTWVQAIYHRMLSFTLRRRADALLLAVLVFISGLVAQSQMKETDQVEPNLNNFTIRMDMESDLRVSERHAAAAEVEEILEENRAAWGIRAVRSRSWGEGSRVRVQVFLEDERDGLPEREQVIEQMEELLPEQPGVESRVGGGRGPGGGGGGGGQSTTLTLFGDDPGQLEEIGEIIATRLRRVPQVTSVESEVESDGDPELLVEVDREAAARYGVSSTVVGRTVSFAMRGSLLPPHYRGEKRTMVQAGYRLEDRAGIDKMMDFRIFSPTIGSVPLSAVADLSRSRGAGRIRRENRRTSHTITIELEGDDLSTARRQIGEALSELSLPRGYSWAEGRRFRRKEEDDQAQFTSLLMAVGLVFLLMAALFESLLLPLAVMVSVPFALVGVWWLLALTGTPMDTMAGIGLVILVGIVVNNAIVLIDRVQQLRAEGMARDQAILLSGRQRLRPILMTAGTTIVGLLPMALGDASLVGIPYYPLGRAVIGGLVASTLLTLLLVPLAYTLFDDFAGWLSRLWRWSRAGRTTPEKETA